MSTRMSNFITIVTIIYTIICATHSDTMTVHRYVHEKTNELFYAISNNKTTQILLEMSTGELKCFKTDKGLIRHIKEKAIYSLSSLEKRKFLVENKEIISKCTINSTFKRTKRSILQRIFPGTKWCGPGNIAQNENDYGEEIEADKCCQVHDRCPNSIRSGDTKWNFKNKLSYTLMECGCDDEFYLCLKEANTDASDKIGKLFFNFVRMECFQTEVINTCLSWYIPGVWCRRKGRRLGVKLYHANPWN